MHRFVSLQAFSCTMDNEKGSISHLEVVRDEPAYSSPEAAQIAAMSPEEYAAFEKKLVRKQDLNIIPWITWVLRPAQRTSG